VDFGGNSRLGMIVENAQGGNGRVGMIVKECTGVDLGLIM